MPESWPVAAVKARRVDSRRAGRAEQELEVAVRAELASGSLRWRARQRELADRYQARESGVVRKSCQDC